MHTVKRLFTAQGGLQVLTALAAARHRAQAAPHSVTYADYLVIYGLAAPPESLTSFVEYIKELATAVHSWEQIVYLAAEDVHLNDKTSRVARSQDDARALHALVGTAEADEVYMVSDWTPGSQALLHAYADALKICYGDGIGYYVPAATFEPAGLKFQVKKRIKQLVFKRYSFDQGYFQIPALFGAIPAFPYESYQPGHLLHLVERAAQSSRFTLAPYLEQLPPTAEQIAFVALGNFSEAGWITEDDEIAAYGDTLRSFLSPQAVLLIKPHPRQTSRKLQRLTTSLQAEFADVRQVRDMPPYVPAELLFASLAPAVTQRMSVVGFTSAVIALQHLFGLRCRIGFGEDVISKRFLAPYVDMMTRNERRLNEAMGRS